MTGRQHKMVAPECEMGYTAQQLDDILGGRREEFARWMGGQTMTLCQGEGDCDRPHGVVVYRHDLERFLAGGPVID